jgi:hypothetical protein
VADIDSHARFRFIYLMQCVLFNSGKQYGSTAVCVESKPGPEPAVDEKHCGYLVRLKTLKKSCNQHCSLVWRPANHSTCSAECGPGTQTVEYGCMRVMPNQPDLVLPDQYCEELDDADKRPPATVKCEGTRCEGVKWRYGHWSECTVSCSGPHGRGGIQLRAAHCVDATGKKVLRDEMCMSMMGSPVTQEQCGIEDCPKWMTGDWTEVCCSRRINLTSFRPQPT